MLNVHGQSAGHGFVAGETSECQNAAHQMQACANTQAQSHTRHTLAGKFKKATWVGAQRKTGHALVGRDPLISLAINGRRGGIRTRDPLHPMQVRYQAALHAEA